MKIILKMLARFSFKKSDYFIIALSLMPVFATFAPRFLAFAPGIAGLLGWMIMRRNPLSAEIGARSYFIWAAGIGVLCAVSGLWALDFSAVLVDGLKIGVIIGLGALFFATLKSDMGLLKEIRPRIFAPLCIVITVMLLYVMYDLWSLGTIYRQLHEDKGEFSTAVLNRSIIALVLMAIMVFWHGWCRENKTPMDNGILGALCVSLAVVLYLTQSQTAQMIVMVAMIFALAFPVRLRAAWIGLGVLILIGIWSAPFAVQVLYDYADLLHNNAFLESAYAAHRLEIWDFVARRTLENPLYGFGMEAASQTSHFDSAMKYRNSDHVLHPHNFVMQLWLEFGMIGAAVLSAFSMFMLRLIYKTGPDNARILLAVFMAVYAAAATSYGLWQSWWIGLFTLLPAFALMILEDKKSSLSAE